MPNRIAWDILLVLITVAGNLWNKFPKWLLEQNSSYSDYFNAIFGLYRIAEPQEALWQQTYCSPKRTFSAVEYNDFCDH